MQVLKKKLSGGWRAGAVFAVLVGLAAWAAHATN